MIPIDPQRVSELIREAGETIVMPRHQQLEDEDIQEKRKGDLVTIADLETESWLTSRLTEILPGSAVVGEEAVFADASVLKWLESDDPVWVVDPIDGTWNFAHGRDAFAIIVALRIGRETVMGWIGEPALETMAIAEHGGGVMVNGAPVAFGKQDAERRPLTGTAARYLFERASEAGPELISDVFRPSSAGHEYVLMLQRERQFSAYTRLLPWDHVAGTFMIGQAGGVSRQMNGAEYDPTAPHGDLLSATGEPHWLELCAALSAPESQPDE